jgi:AAA+ ATPase superfamily predicted ATPase
MKFYNRQQPLSRLGEIADLAQRTAHMMVISGRRRIGKTELIRQFASGRSDVLYLFVSKKKPQALLEEFRDVLADRIPLIKTASFRNFEDFFAFVFTVIKEQSLIIVLDEFQNFEVVEPSVFSTIQNMWDREKDRIKGVFVFIGSVHTLMQRIFEGKKEPLFGRATARIHLEPLEPEAVAEILADHGLDPAVQLPFYDTLFGGVPKYYFLADRYRLYGKSQGTVIRTLYTDMDAPLQDEGRELLIEEFGKNYHLYFTILQVIAGGETQMARIADRAGINVNSISKYLDELVSYYQVIERRLPVTEGAESKKIGRYYLKDQALRFWFRYIFRNQSLIEIGDTEGLTAKILKDLPTLMGQSFEALVRSLLTRKNMQDFLPLRFSRIGGFWNRTGDVEIDIVATNEETKGILFGECKLNGNRFSAADVAKLKEKAARVHWNRESRLVFFALFSMTSLSVLQKETLRHGGIEPFELKDLLPTGNLASTVKGGSVRRNL